MVRPLVLYHANCYDGFGAAWAVRKHLGEIEARPVLYGQPVPADCDYRDVYVVDFSYPRADLLALRERCNKLVVIDHHKTAEEALRGMDFCTFDMEHSGCVLTWRHFTEEPPPDLLLYTEDRDLWRFALPSSREVQAWLRSWPMDFETWDRLAVLGVADHAEEGRSILRAQDRAVSAMSDLARMVDCDGYAVPCSNASIYFSDVGEELCRRHPGSAFALYYFDRADGLRQWGLRSEHGFDCAEIAKHYNGGGHAASAGFTTATSFMFGGART